MNEPDENGYFRFIEDTNKKEMSNSETYDKALLTLSSVLLGLSLTFTQNVVPLFSATCLWLLIMSWSLFALTIIIVIASFIYSQHSFKRLKDVAVKYYLEGDTSTNDLSEEISATIRKINTSSGVTFIAAVILFTVFVGINVNGGNIVKSKNNYEEKSQTPSTYQHQQGKPKPTQSQPQKPQQEQKK